MTDISQSLAERRDRAFLGHPVGLGWLGATEFWERFSYYGMQALLVLYMVHQLFTPEHIHNIIGLDPFVWVVSIFFGGGQGQVLASHIFGFYGFCVYLTPLAGGYIADRFLGRTAAVTLGASLMALGHFLFVNDDAVRFVKQRAPSLVARFVSADNKAAKNRAVAGEVQALLSAVSV